MNRKTFELESSRNKKAFEGLRDRIRTELAGQYVVLAEGNVIATAPTFDEACAAVQRLQPVPEYFVIFPAEEDPSFDLVYD